MQEPSEPPSARAWKPDDPRRRVVEEKRRAILDAARPIFLREGWGGATLDRVAAESGISKMTVYRHFSNKTELFRALVESMCEAMRGEAESAPDTPGSLSPAARLRREAEFFTAALVRPDALALYRIIVADGWRFPALARVFERSGMAVLRSRIASILSSLDLADDDCAGRASSFIAIALGDAYLEAAIGLDDPNRDRRFADQIAAAVCFAVL